MKSSRFDTLDLARGLSAILVCASHLRAALFVDYKQLQNPTLLDKIFYFSTSLGHEAVIVFFVLSGFFVGGSVLRSGKLFSAQTYITTRLSRLWIVLIPALIITALLDYTTQQLQPTIITGARFNEWNSGPLPGAYSSTLSTFFANIFFLQTITSPVYGSNGPLWSLANEFYYYLLFPILTCATYITGSYKATTRIILGVTFFAIISLLPRNIIDGFLVWLLGVIIYVLSEQIKLKKRLLLTLTSTLFLFTSIIYSKSPSWQSNLGMSGDLAVGLGFSFFAFFSSCYSNDKNFKAKFYGISISKILSQFSYSLYLIHFPVLVFLSALIFPKSQLSPQSTSYYIFFAFLVLLIASGYLFWLAFEKHTTSLRRRFNLIVL